MKQRYQCHPAFHCHCPLSRSKHKAHPIPWHLSRFSWNHCQVVSSSILNKKLQKIKRELCVSLFSFFCQFNRILACINGLNDKIDLARKTVRISLMCCFVYSICLCSLGIGPCRLLFCGLFPRIIFILLVRFFLSRWRIRIELLFL